MKNKLLGLGILLLGIAAVGRVALSWTEYKEQLRRQEQQELIKRQVQLEHESIIRACSEKAAKATLDTFDKFRESGALPPNLDIHTEIEKGYKYCLHLSGIES